MKQSQSQPDALERRSHSRATTQRPATVIADARASRFCQGRLIELGVGGFRVVMPVCLPAGTEVELEFINPERPGSPAARVRGRIAWTRRNEADGWLSGGPFKVQFRAGNPESAPLASAREARALLGRMRSDLTTVSAQDLLPILMKPRGGRVAGNEGISARVSKVGGTSRTWTALRRFLRTAAALLLVAALLLLVLLLGAIARDLPIFSPGGQRALAARSEHGVTSSESIRRAPLVDADDGEANRPAKMTLAGEGRSVDPFLMATLPVGNEAGEGKAPEGANGDNALSPTRTAKDFTGELFAPLEDPPLGTVELFADVLKSVPMDAALAHSNWQLYDRALSQYLREGGSDRMPDELDELLESPSKAGGLASNTVGETAATKIFVDTQRFLLSVMQGSTVLAVFPVGLGAHQSTPEGTFEVANKLKAPQWFNRGRPIPAGDQRNPLGEYWIGLGNGQGPTSYGIHPTKEAESIGAARSRGCIRMRPGDAARVFGWCRIGTPVIIGPFLAPASVVHS